MEIPVFGGCHDGPYKAYPLIRGAILHSDKGSQYTSELYRKAINKYDTSTITVERVKTLIWRYFIRYWNNTRICSANGGLPPLIKRQQYYASLQEAA